MYCFSGQWNYALKILAVSKATFSRLSENKKWREVTFMEGLCLFYLSKFKEAINVFQSLVESGSGEGDLYYELSGRYMREVAIITVHGPSSAIQDSLLSVGTMGEDLNMTPSQALPHGGMTHFPSFPSHDVICMIDLLCDMVYSVTNV